MILELDIPDPLLNITDREINLIWAHNEVFPESRHLLCAWHIDKDVLRHCKKFFHTKEDWEDFYTAWRTVAYAFSRVAFENAWDKLQDDYEFLPEAISYLANTWVHPYKRKFVTCFTNEVLHFKNVVSSKGESGHALLKRELKISTGDLAMVVEKIKTLLTRIKTTYVGLKQQAMATVAMELRKPIFRHIIAEVSPYAMRRLLE